MHLKGIVDFDIETAYEAMLNSYQNHLGLDSYKKTDYCC
ncbi:MAG: hypothetical protein CM15mP107_2300 [Bacteroidota bacterium]|nr:MAG: hypothetical protein CM15mP107_2300 [Bacteroidota bacterium]